MLQQHKNKQGMISLMTLSQASGFLAFLAIFSLGFWLMIFLVSFVIPYWIGGYLLEEWKLRKKKK